MLEIIQPSTRAELDQVRRLIRGFVAWSQQRYATEIAFVERYFNQGDFEAELAHLPGKYSPPQGRLLLAVHDGEPAGCVALRPIGDGICEMKRLFVDVPHQGKGVGRSLVAELIREARAAGYETMRLDTGPGQAEAQQLYRKMGFRVIGPYSKLPEELAHWLIFMELDLHRHETI